MRKTALSHRRRYLRLIVDAPDPAVVPAIVFVTVNVALLFYGWRFRSRPGGRAFPVFVLAGAGWARLARS
ncbi:MAG: hypothetical protein U0556_07735 [Dehalococcoidia bacterium]